ncbi:MAG: efflux transporter periplasmic adaptor subunit [Bacteroidetes bacterium CG12_big_fil_rev_8_21_14_0_65_60_17]|nr:MAG: efflux transporter periplasmic adaptor subunit [Bacteroidetes bacterium CG12_big_fil_rev_8_21_14_0_65_60_17]
MQRYSTLVLLLVLAACQNSGDMPVTDRPGSLPTPSGTTTSERTLQVETAVLEPEPFTEVIQLTGSVVSMNDAVLSAETAGTVVEMAPLGTQVAQGAVVLRLDDRLVRSTLDQARAAARSAEAAFRLANQTFNRQERLFADSIISFLEFENVTAQRDQAAASLSQAEAAVRSVERQLEFTAAQAPFAGTIEEHLVDPGEQVSPGMPLLRIVNTEFVRVRAGVPETYANDIRKGTPVEVGFRSYGGPSRNAKVTFASSVIDPASRTFTVEIELDNPDRVLKPEMIADLLLARKTWSDQVVVPQNAILRDEVGYTVYVVENGRAALRTVTPGPSHAGRTLIRSGLEAGDELIVNGQTNITAGDAVRVVNTEN